MNRTRNLNSKYVMRDDDLPTIAQQVCTNYANCAAGRPDGCFWRPQPGPTLINPKTLTLKSATDSGDSYVCDFGSEKVTINHFSTPPKNGGFACDAAAPSSTPNTPMPWAPKPPWHKPSGHCEIWGATGGPCSDPGNYPCYNALLANGIIAKSSTNT